MTQHAEDDRLTKIVADALRQHWDRKDAMSLEGCCAAIAVQALRDAGALIDGDADLRAIFGEPVEGRDYEQVDGTEIGTWTEQYDGDQRG